MNNSKYAIGDLESFSRDICHGGICLTDFQKAILVALVEQYPVAVQLGLGLIPFNNENNIRCFRLPVKLAGAFANEDLSVTRQEISELNGSYLDIGEGVVKVRLITYQTLGLPVPEIFEK